VDVSYSPSRISNNPGISEISNCVKCEEVKEQLQKLLYELSSAYLIIQMLEKESKTDDTTTTMNQHKECECIKAGDWKVKLTKGNKGSPEGKTEIRITEGKRPTIDIVELRNCFSALATDKEMRISENKMNNSDN